jgi:hypothetical protein
MGQRDIFQRVKWGIIRYLSYMPISDRLYIQLRYWLTFGRKPDLIHPKTYTEKIQWLKLYDTRSEYTHLSDKYAVRSYISELVGESYLVPLLGVFEKIEDIPFQDLPPKFVLKATHGCGWNIMCHAKDRLDIPRVKRQLKTWLSSNYYQRGRETVYKNISPRIICEEMLPLPPDGLPDFKFVCFSGKAQYIQIDSDRFTNHTQSFYDLDWRRLPFECAYPSCARDYAPPSRLKEMIELAECLADNIPLVRVDQYLVEGQIYIGEMTFSPGNGFFRFKPEEWDHRFGDRLNLPAPSR